MRMVLACYGSRGDIEPSVAVGRELVRRGHTVDIAVSPNLVGFAQAAGLNAVAYGLDTHLVVEAQRNYWGCFFGSPWRVKDLARMGRVIRELNTDCWQKMTTTLIDLTDGADLLFTGLTFEQPAANVAEYFGVPLATLDYYPVRPNGQLLPHMPAWMVRNAWAAGEWLNWRTIKRDEDRQRRGLGLREAGSPTSRRMTRSGALQIQAYDEVWFPGLAAEWTCYRHQRPFVGTLTMEASTDADDEVLSWITAGTPPVFFGFGTIPIASPELTLAMISAACGELGERALVVAGSTPFPSTDPSDRVKVVSSVSYSKVFPACRAVVHHGGAGTLAAGLRAGVPTLVLWTLPDQPIWGAQLKRMKVGTARRLSATSPGSLVKDLRTILDPEYAQRAREVAAQMTTADESVMAAADHLERFAGESRRARRDAV